MGKSLALQVELYNPFNDSKWTTSVYIYTVCVYILYLIYYYILLLLLLLLYIKLVVIVDVPAGGWGEHEPIYNWEDPLCTNQTIDPDILR